MSIPRKPELAALRSQLRETNAVAILGPRQCGKTTLARQYIASLSPESVHMFDLENPRHLEQLRDPMLALENKRGTIVIDEVQRQPEIFPLLRVLIDQFPDNRYLVLGSASRDLLRQSSESLAGRISYMEIGGFNTRHIQQSQWGKLWYRGGFPRSFLAGSVGSSVRWRSNFIRTFLERDLPSFSVHVPHVTMRRFWTMLAHHHGQLLNTAEIGRSIDADHKSVRQYFDTLTSTYMVRQLQPWHYNTKKRLVKHPKFFLRDSGLLHTLLSIRTEQELHEHPKLGASWEGFALEQLVSVLNIPEDELFFWGAHAYGELDLVFPRGGKLWGVELKYCASPTFTKSMRVACSELPLKHAWVVYPGDEQYLLHKNVTALPLSDLPKIAKHIG